MSLKKKLYVWKKGNPNKHWIFIGFWIRARIVWLYACELKEAFVIMTNQSNYKNGSSRVSTIINSLIPFRVMFFMTGENDPRCKRFLFVSRVKVHESFRSDFLLISWHKFIECKRMYDSRRRVWFSCVFSTERTLGPVHENMMYVHRKWEKTWSIWFWYNLLLHLTGTKFLITM